MAKDLPRDAHIESAEVVACNFNYDLQFSSPLLASSEDCFLHSSSLPLMCLSGW